MSQLQELCAIGDVLVVQDFLQNIAEDIDYSAVDADGKTAFGIVFENNNPELFRVLFEDFKMRSAGDDIKINNDLLSIVNDCVYDQSEYLNFMWNSFRGIGDNSHDNTFENLQESCEEIDEFFAASATPTSSSIAPVGLASLLTNSPQHQI